MTPAKMYHAFLQGCKHAITGDQHCECPYENMLYRRAFFFGFCAAWYRRLAQNQFEEMLALAGVTDVESFVWLAVPQGGT